VAFYLTKAKLQFRAGQMEEARKILEQGRHSAECRGFDRLRLNIELESIRQSLHAADLAEAQRFLNQFKSEDSVRRLRPGPETTSRDETMVLAWNRACCALGCGRDTLKALKDWVAFARDRGSLKSEVSFLIALAVNQLFTGSEGEALRSLREAVKKAARPRFIRCFVDEGPAVEGLLRKLFSPDSDDPGAATEFGLLLINSFESESSAERVDVSLVAEHLPDSAPPEALNQTERDVLRLIAIGMSNKDIAHRLGLTVGCVKWYMQQIFMKLDVRRRTMAVRRAQQFGMI